MSQMSSASRGRTGLKIGAVHSVVATITVGLVIGGCTETREGRGGEHTQSRGSSASTCASTPCRSAAPAAPSSPGASPEAPSSPGASGAHISRDEDGDWDSNSDENAIRYYGKPANPRDREAIVTAIRRYYEAIATGDSARACSLIDPGFGHELLDAYGRQSSATTFQEACSSLLSNKLLGHRAQRQGAHDLPRVIAVRVARDNGYVLLAFRRSPVSEMPIANSAGSWKMASVFDLGLP